MADRVARGLVAGRRQQDEERGDLGVGESLAVDLGLHERRAQVSAELLRRSVAIATPKAPISCATCSNTAKSSSVSNSPRITFVQRKTRSSSSSGMPIIEQMICSGSGAATSRTTSQRPSGWRSTMRRTMFAGTHPHRVLDERHDLRCERLLHDHPQAGMPRVVEHDHRPEELGNLRMAGRRARSTGRS